MLATRKLDEERELLNSVVVPGTVLNEDCLALFCDQVLCGPGEPHFGRLVDLDPNRSRPIIHQPLATGRLDEDLEWPVGVGHERGDKLIACAVCLDMASRKLDHDARSIADGPDAVLDGRPPRNDELIRIGGWRVLAAHVLREQKLRAGIPDHVACSSAFDDGAFGMKERITPGFHAVESKRPPRDSGHHDDGRKRRLREPVPWDEATSGRTLERAKHTHTLSNDQFAREPIRVSKLVCGLEGGEQGGLPLSDQSESAMAPQSKEWLDRPRDCAGHDGEHRRPPNGQPDGRRHRAEDPRDQDKGDESGPGCCSEHAHGQHGRRCDAKTTAVLGKLAGGGSHRRSLARVCERHGALGKNKKKRPGQHMLVRPFFGKAGLRSPCRPCRHHDHGRRRASEDRLSGSPR